MSGRKRNVEAFSWNCKMQYRWNICVTVAFEVEVNNVRESLTIATRRFLSGEHKLQRNYSLREAYVAFMEECGHMYEVPERDTPLCKQFNLPHHLVLKLSSLMTKLRAIFDASAKCSSEISQRLKRGPTV